MKSTNIILLGIALILFGIAMILVSTARYYSWSQAGILGIICPFVGIILSVYGCLKNDSK